MKATLMMACASALSVIGTIAGAQAHTVLEPASAAAGNTTKIVLRVPHGCEGEATHTVKVRIPEGVLAVKPMAEAGWELATHPGPYEQHDDHHGASLSKGVREIVWSGGPLEDAWSDEFVFRAAIADLPAGATLDFPATELCAEGEVAWDEVAAPGEDPHDLARPAPRLTVLVADSHGGHAAHSGHDPGMAVAGDLEVSGGWARETAATQKNGAAYFTLVNRGETADRLIAAASPGAERVEFHETVMANDVMKMREVTAFDIAPGGSLALEPGGLHVMLIGLARPLVDGETLSVTLTFERAGEVSLEVPVKSVRYNPAAGGEHKH